MAVLPTMSSNASPVSWADTRALRALTRKSDCIAANGVSLKGEGQEVFIDLRLT